MSTADVAAIVRIAMECGARIVGTAETLQLTALEASGMFRLLIANHGAWPPPVTVIRPPRQISHIRIRYPKHHFRERGGPVFGP